MSYLGRSTYVWKVASFSALVVLLIQTVTIKYIVPQLDRYQTVVVLASIAANLGLYLGIFNLLVTVYKNHLWKLFNREFYIEGRWTHTIRDGETGELHYGVIWVRQSADEIEIWGENYEPGSHTNMRSNWHATSVWFDGHQLNYNYQMERTTPGLRQKSGRVTAHLDGGVPPLRIRGSFCDSNSNPSQGEVIWQYDCELRTEGRGNEAELPPIPAHDFLENTCHDVEEHDPEEASRVGQNHD